jgi:molybdate transport system substrate-binding protein
MGKHCEVYRHKRGSILRLFIATLTLAALCAPLANADEIRVLSGGAAKALVEPLAQSFKAATGHLALVEFQPMGPLTERLAKGEAIDMVILTSDVLERLEREGKLPKGIGRPIARVGVGVAVNENAPLPDISTAEAFKRTVLAAKSLVYIDPTIGTSGKHVATVLEKLGIAEQMKAKTTLLKGGYVVEPVGRGEIELGIHQISEIMPVKGIRLVGPLPEELQKYTVYVAVPVPGTPHGAAVAAFISHLTGPAAGARLTAAGDSAP